MKRASLVFLAMGSFAACSGSVGGDGPNGGGGKGGSGKGGSGGGDVVGGTNGTVDLSSCDDPANAGPGNWRRLSRVQYENAVADLLKFDADTNGFLQDTGTGPFATNALVPAEPAAIEQYNVSASDLAKKAVGNLNTLLACDRAAKGDDVCAAAFIDAFGARAYRRPLTAAEKTAFNKVYLSGKESDFATGIALVVEATLQSPSFLYLVEQGTDAGGGLKKLNGYEVAARLAFTLTGSIPDTELTDAARNGALDGVDGIKAQAERLIGSPRFVKNVARFHSELLGTEALKVQGFISKESAKYPGFNDAMRAAMGGEITQFVDFVMTKSEGTLTELFTAPMAFPTGPLVGIYGGGTPDGDGRVTFDDNTRHGLLTTAAVMAAFPKVPTKYSAVGRGHMVRRDLLCQDVPPPSQMVEFKPPPNADQLSQQELLRAHSNPTCAGCHTLMDPLGFALEQYDLIGTFRDKLPSGEAIDASGHIEGVDDSAFTNAGGMTDKLVSSAAFRSCMSSQWFRFALAREPDSAKDACSLARMDEVFYKGGGNVRDAVLTLVASDAFRFRRGE
jgi:Protein of unknown function (DUF1592)/Protein of unknown function (DUF1588)/Protein of unknown function (DUF1595)/Protein of unknown function (DUF1585)/Protein of unknown function (DUF1587)